MTGIGIGLGLGFGSVRLRDPAVAAIIAAMSPAPNAARAARINTLVLALKTAGIWSLLDVFYVTAAQNTGPSLLNWKAPGTRDLIAVNSPAFVADAGYTSNGSTSRLRTQYTPSTDGVNFIQDNASVWTWVTTEIAENILAVGNINNVITVGVKPRVATTGGGRLNDGTDDLRTIASSIGFTGVSRAGAAIKRVWKNGVKQGADFTTASTGISSLEQWVCGGSNGHFSAAQVAIAAWGAALTGLELTFYNALNAYMTGLASDYPAASGDFFANRFFAARFFADRFFG